MCLTALCTTLPFNPDAQEVAERHQNTIAQTGFVLGFLPYLETAFRCRRKQLPLKVSRMELTDDAGKTTEIYLMECIWVSMSCSEMKTNQPKNQKQTKKKKWVSKYSD